MGGREKAASAAGCGANTNESFSDSPTGRACCRDRSGTIRLGRRLRVESPGIKGGFRWVLGPGAGAVLEVLGRCASELALSLSLSLLAVLSCYWLFGYIVATSTSLSILCTYRY